MAGLATASVAVGRNAGRDGGPVAVEDPVAKIMADSDKVAKRLFETYGRPPWIAASAEDNSD